MGYLITVAESKADDDIIGIYSSAGQATFKLRPELYRAPPFREKTPGLAVLSVGRRIEPE